MIISHAVMAVPGGVPSQPAVHDVAWQQPEIFLGKVKPLTYLTESANRIAAGHYDESIPNVKRNDEVGAFYKNFQGMY